MDAGVRVFKLEGRARGPEYVRLVTECYKEAVKAYCEGTFDEEKIAVWDERLRRVFNRVSGMATIWDNDWVNGAVNMAPVLPVRKCTWHGVSNTSAESVSPSLRWSPVP